MVTIDGLVDVVEQIAGVKLKRTYDPRAPKGVNARNSDNTLIQKSLSWAPSICLRDGLATTYAWVHDETARGTRRSPGAQARATAT